MAPLSSPTDSAVTVEGLIAMSAAATRAAFPVRGPHGTIVGIVPGDALRGVHPKRRSTTRAGDLAVGWAQFTSAHRSEGLSDVIERMQTGDVEHVLVYDASGNQVGYLGAAQLLSLATPTPA